MTTTLVGSTNGVDGFADGDSTTALLNEPMGVAVRDGFVYVADSLNHAIRKISMLGAVSTLCGSLSDGNVRTALAGFRDGGSPLFNKPYALTFDANGTLYVADALNYAIRAVSPLGVVATLVGKRSRGNVDGFLASSAFDTITDLVYYEPETSLYVVDQGNYAVRKVTLPGTPLFPRFAMTSCARPESCKGSSESGTQSACDVPDACSTISTPFALTAAQPSITIVSQFELTYADDSYYFTTVTPPAVNYYITISFSSFFTEHNFDFVSLYDGDTLLMDRLSGSFRPTVRGSCGNAIAVHFVSESSNVDSGITFTASASPCVESRRLSDETQLESADDESFSGSVSTIVGNPAKYFSLDGYGTNAAFFLPFGIGISSDGFMFVSDQGGGYDESGSKDAAAASQTDFIRFITPGGRMTTIAGAIYKGGGAPPSGDGTNAVFSNPSGLAVDSDGSVYIADAEYPAIRKIDVIGGGWGSATPTPSGTPSHSPSPTSTPSVRQINGYMAALVTTIAHLPATSLGNNTDEDADAREAFSHPSDVAFNSTSSNAIVSDCDHNRLRSISSNGTVTTVAGNGRARLRDGSALFASLSCPAGIDFDDKGDLYFADLGNHAIRVFSQSSGDVSTFAGRSKAGYADGPAALFSEPYDVVFFGRSNSSTFLLWVARDSS